ncbi:MAG: hypothetical protein UR26_C0001G0176 [candidate division TM6 bacterium GW2011_GWF2_32_72]|nr:MAG: hypothetical protein UR26_C0001G0176 [candidate division TM6 bacterium GW2011_GWF2_32_72]
MNIELLKTAVLAISVMFVICKAETAPVSGSYKLEYMSTEKAVLPMVKAAQVLVAVKKNPLKVHSYTNKLYAPFIQAAANETSTNLEQLAQMSKNTTEEIDNKLFTISAVDKKCLIISYFFISMAKKTNLEHINRHVDRLMYLTQTPGSLNNIHQAISKLKGATLINISDKMSDLTEALTGKKHSNKKRNSDEKKSNDQKLGDELISQLTWDLTPCITKSSIF